MTWHVRPCRPSWSGLTLFLGFLLHAVFAGSIVYQATFPAPAPAHARALLWYEHHDSVHRGGPGGDFFALYRAGHYARNNISVYSKSRLPGVPGAYPYRYLPFTGQTLGATLAHLSPFWAYVAWLTIVEATMLATAWCMCRREPSSILRVVLALTLMLSSPFWLELYMGQFTFVACALVALALMHLQRTPVNHSHPTRYMWVAFGWASAVLLKVFPVVALPALVHHPKGRWIITGIVACVLAATVPHFIEHPVDWTTFCERNFANIYQGLDAGNFSWLHAIHLIAKASGVALEPTTWSLICKLWQGGILGITALVVLLSRRRDPLIAAAVLMLAHFLSYVHVWEHHMSGALVFVLLLAQQLRQHGLMRRAWLCLACGILLALPTPYYWLDTAADPKVWNVSRHWPWFLSLSLVACKALPLMVAYGVGLSASYVRHLQTKMNKLCVKCAS